MTVATALAIAAAVWSVGMLRSVRLRALVYSLPVPMSLALAGSHVRVDGTQLAGVVLLVAFFALIAVLHLRLGWPVLLADAAAAVAYAVASWSLPASLPLLPALAGVVVLWAVGLTLPGPPAADTAAEMTVEMAVEMAVDAVGRRSALRAAAKLVAVVATTMAVLALGDLLSGLVVTFPYSGVLVAVEARHQLAAFARHFARTAIALVAFLTGYALLQDRGLAPALLAGWVSFAACVVPVHLGPRRRRQAAMPARTIPKE